MKVSIIRSGRIACIWLLFCIVCLLPSFAGAASLVSALQVKYDGIASMKTEFTQILIHKETGAKEHRSGILFFQKPLLVRWETTKPTPELLIVNNKEIWDVFADEDIAYKYPLSMVQDSRSIVQVITGQARIDKDFTVEEESKEGALTKLNLYPKEPTQTLVQLILWVNPETTLIQKLRVYDFFGNENEITFTSLQPGAPVSAGAFTFSAPKGMTIEDHSKGGGKATKSRKGKTPML